MTLEGEAFSSSKMSCCKCLGRGRVNADGNYLEDYHIFLNVIRLTCPECNGSGFNYGD